MNKYKDTIKRILLYIGNYKWMVFISLLLAFITVVLTLYTPILIGQAVDLITGKGRVNFLALLFIMKNIGLIVLITSLAQWIMNIINNKITYRVVKDIRTRAFNQLSNLPLKYLDSHENGDIISRIIADVDQFSDGLLMGFTQLFTGIITILGTLLFMFSINKLIAIVVILVTPLSLFVAAFIAKKTYFMFRLQSQTRGELTSLVEETLGNEKVVQAFSQEEEVINKFKEINGRLKECSEKSFFYSSITNPATRFVNGLVYSAVGITGAIAALRGYLSIGQLSSFLSYANQYTKPFNEISGVVTELQNALASAARVFELIDELQENPDSPDAIDLQEVDGSVSIEDVHFSYIPHKPLIEAFNLKVKPGQRVAIVGPTGSGKSTVINLLMGFYEVDSGSIKISGNDTRKLTRKSLRNSFGMILQETWLKSGTISENIAYGKPGASKDEIIKASKDAHAHSFIKKMAKGYDTIITEDGGNLSEGQRQLLSIARVMLSLPSMLILDEATSSIDTRTEIEIQKTFDKMMEGRTSFIVAHRLSTIREADIIIFMDNGHIVESGTHESLLAKNGFYAELYNSQFQGK